jgi:hypothetical protein
VNATSPAIAAASSSWIARTVMTLSPQSSGAKVQVVGVVVTPGSDGVIVTVTGAVGAADRRITTEVEPPSSRSIAVDGDTCRRAPAASAGLGAVGARVGHRRVAVPRQHVAGVVDLARGAGERDRQRQDRGAHQNLTAAWAPASPGAMSGVTTTCSGAARPPVNHSTAAAAIAAPPTP